MPPALKCPLGKRVAAATVVGDAPPRKAPSREWRQWRLLCDCGVEFTADVNRVSAGKANRCRGCARALLHSKNWRHGCAATGRGRRATKEYEIWSGIKRRCQ